MGIQQEEILRKKLRYQSWYRGCKETDKILGYFAKEYLDDMPLEGMRQFEGVLSMDDKLFFDIMCGTQQIPPEMESNDILHRLREFNVSHFLAPKA